MRTIQKGRWPGFVMAGLLGLFLVACEQSPALQPQPERVVPALVAAGQERYVRIEGSFEPLVQWRPGDSPEVDTWLEVRFGEHRATEVRRESSSALVVRIPAIDQSGCHDVAVTRAGGLRGVLAGGLCVGDVEEPELLHGCLVDESTAALCSTSLSDLSINVLVEDVMPVESEESGLFQTDSPMPGYAISPDGAEIAFLRDVYETGKTRRLMLGRLDDPGWEVELASAPQPADDKNPANESLDYSAVGSLTFSPDGRFLAYVLHQRRLMIQTVPMDPGQVSEPVELASVPERSGQRLAYPGIDIASGLVLFTWIRSRDEAEGVLSAVAMYVVPVDGSSAPRKLLDQESDTIKNGPGVFHPGGGRVVFVSDRLQMRIMTPFGIWLEVINLYELDLATQEVAPLTRPTAGFWTGKPAVSPDGRLAANVGFISDETFSGLDLLVTDLAVGTYTRVGGDGSRFCYPSGEEYCLAGSVYGCCTVQDAQQRCCSQAEPEWCPTWEQAPAFSQDSRMLAGNFYPLIWYCFDSDGTGFGKWNMAALDINVYLAGLTGDDPPWHTEVLDREAYNLENLSMAPSFYQRIEPPAP